MGHVGGVTKDGQNGERIGVIHLRQTTYWRGEGPGILLLFDVSKNAANFDLVIQALVTNDLSLDDEIVLAFERLLREKLKDEWLVIAAANPTRKVNFKSYC